jgi:quercetin dioxygenase-like cupin family protein
MIRGVGIFAACTLGAFVVLCGASQAQDTKRTELKKGDLTGTNMEIIVGLVEIAPGATVPLHTHPGEEAFYVIEGGTAETPDGKQIELAPGVADINARDVPHGGVKISGSKPIKLLTVHIVDKGKPMTVPVKKD